MDSDTKGGHPQIGMNRIRRAAESVGTPAYVYDLDIIRERFGTLTRLFGRNFGVSFAAKSNPNIELLIHWSQPSMSRRSARSKEA